MPRKGENVYHRKDGLWEARYVKEIDVNGKKKYGSVYAHSCGEVKKKRQAILDRMLLYGDFVSVRTISVEQLVGEWLRLNKCRLRTSSYQKYARMCRNHIIPIIG